MRRWALRSFGGIIAACLGTLALHPALASEKADPSSVFKRAEQQGVIGVARKTKLVDARPARPGEVIVTINAGQGTETRSKPAEAGDMVVRNRCEATGNEQYLVKAAKFAERYGEPMGPVDGEGWRPFRPKGLDMLYVMVRPEDGTFTFTAPWGEPMVAHPGDALVRDPSDPKDTYRVAAASFACTYVVIKPAGSR